MGFQAEVNLSPSLWAWGETGSCGWSRGPDAGGSGVHYSSWAGRPGRGDEVGEGALVAGPALLGGLLGCSLVEGGLSGPSVQAGAQALAAHRARRFYHLSSTQQGPVLRSGRCRMTHELTTCTDAGPPAPPRGHRAGCGSSPGACPHGEERLGVRAEVREPSSTLPRDSLVTSFVSEMAPART